jgi:Flp pilus assembly protein TadG
MRATCNPAGSRAAKGRRNGAAAVEFACCLPLMLMILTGLWEVGRIVALMGVISNSAREAARDASLGQDNLSAVAARLLSYLQSADKTTFGQGHTTSMIAPVVSLPANTTGYTCWDNTSNKELFTLSFSDLTTTSTTDPSNMNQLDLYTIGVQVPTANIAWSTIIPVPGTTRLSVSVTWASMVDSPFQITPNLPAQ